MLTSVAAALVLALDPGQIPPPARQAPPEFVETTIPAAPKPLRSGVWTALGTYGMAATFAGGGGVVAEYGSRSSLTGRNVKAGLLGAIAGAAAGLVPGYLLGQGSREPDNEKGRGAVMVLDAAGTAALFYAFTQIFHKDG